MKEKDRESLIAIYKRLDMYVGTNPEIYQLMPEERVLDEKIMMWTIKELYQSPYKIYLNSLKQKDFLLKFYKTKKYITAKPNYQLKEVIDYFIVCLYEEMERTKG